MYRIDFLKYSLKKLHICNFVLAFLWTVTPLNINIQYVLHIPKICAKFQNASLENVHAQNSDTPSRPGIVYKRTPLTKKFPPCLCTRLLRTNPKMKLFSRNGGTTPLSSSSSSNSPNAKFSTSNGLEKQRRPSKSSRPSTLKKKKENNYYASNDLILPTGKF